MPIGQYCAMPMKGMASFRSCMCPHDEPGNQLNRRELVLTLPLYRDFPAGGPIYYNQRICFGVSIQALQKRLNPYQSSEDTTGEVGGRYGAFTAATLRSEIGGRYECYSICNLR